MLVREVMSSPVATCAPTDSLADAARWLWDQDCGVLPVVDARGSVGAMITDRDICMAAYTTGKSLPELRVADAMSQDLVTCKAGDRVSAAAGLMATHRVRRLPVVDDEGKICGVLSLNDLARAATKNTALGRDALQVLAAAGQRRERAVAATPTAKERAATSSS
ncbi:MAG: CBS domain-containing protein [Planctomycetota bacterium]